MQVVRAMRLRAKEADAKKLESIMAKQVQQMHGAASDVVLYVCVKRSETGSFFSNPRPGTTEYLFLAAAREGGAQQLAANESAQFWSDLQATLDSAIEVEEIDQPDFVCGVTRDMSWTPQSMWRLSLYRMRVKPNDGEMEDAIQKMIARVRDLEPDPRIYALTKRKPGTGSSLLPEAPSGRDEYIRFHAYQDEEKGLNWHYHFDHKWWSGFYQPRLDGPLEAQQIFSDDIIAGFTRDNIWGNPTEYNAEELETKE